MRNIRDLGTYRESILPAEHMRRIDRMRDDLDASQARLSMVGGWLDTYTDVLTNFSSRLKGQITACDKSLAFHSECQQALEQDSVFHMIKVRDRLIRERNSRLNAPTTPVGASEDDAAAGSAGQRNRVA